eukprot:gene5711-7106_t
METKEESYFDGPHTPIELDNHNQQQSNLEIEPTSTSTSSSPIINNDNNNNNLKKSFNNFKNKVIFSFRDINHYVNVVTRKEETLENGKVKKGKKTKVSKQILTDINGEVKPGELLAIMGPSGAGKTSLLDILAHRLAINGTGEMRLNHSKSSFQVFKRLSGYVTQSDTLTASMTVRETLEFYSQLKMPRNTTYQEKMKRVDEVIAEMGLKRCADTLVGGEKIRGISAIGYFNQMGIHCNPSINPADFFMDLINTQVEDKVDDEDDEDDLENNNKKIKRLTPEEVNRLKVEFSNSTIHETLKQSLAIHSEKEDTPVVYEKHQPPTFFTQFRLLLGRELLHMKRHPMAFRVQLMQAIFQGLLCGLVYYQLGVGQSTVQSRSGVLAFVIMGIGFPSVMSSIHVFPEIITIFLKDRASGVYDTLPFFIAKSFIDVILGVILPVITGTMVYWFTNQRIEPFYSAVPFFKFLLILVLAFQTCLSLGMLISSSVPSVQVGTAVGPLIVILFFLFSGFFINLNDVPRGWSWFPYISFFKYIVEAAVVNAFTGIKFSCRESQMIQGECPIQTGEEVIRNMDYGIDHYWRNIWVIILYIIAFRSLTFMVLRIKSRNKIRAN